MAKYIVKLGKTLEPADKDRVYHQGEIIELSDEDIKKYGDVLEPYEAEQHADLVKLAPKEKHEASFGVKTPPAPVLPPGSIAAPPQRERKNS